MADRGKKRPYPETLERLLQEERWEEAIARTRAKPEEVVSYNTSSSPLALACRIGAPFECIKVLLEARPELLRLVLGARGTPLHEAIVCEKNLTEETKVIRLLLRFDEAMGQTSFPRATLAQDVDGFTPLHLLIRRRFQSYISNESTSLPKILDLLVSSCPESVVIPDWGEYEEPPIVYALKADIYAPMLGTDDEEMLLRIESVIHEMVSTMLKHAPFAASKVFSGFRGHYSSLHSAVFHGRFTTTIDLLLRTQADFPSDPKPALLTNTQSEIPLHFWYVRVTGDCLSHRTSSAMRGERPRTVDLLANAAPEAVTMRDASGLTPFHWLWVRFVSTLLSIDDDGRGADSSVALRTNVEVNYETNAYNEFTVIEQGNFETDLNLIRRFDPPVDFLRMRHIPGEVSNEEDASRWANHSIEVLQRIRTRFQQLDDDRQQLWSRLEVIVSLFWTKTVSLLLSFQMTKESSLANDSKLVHAAFACPGCVPPLAFIAGSLFLQELKSKDSKGRLPVHYAAARKWHAWDWPRGDGTNDPASSDLLKEESLRSLSTAIRISPRESMRTTDNENRLPIHLVVESFVSASCQPIQVSSQQSNSIAEMIKILHELISYYPECLHRRDGVTLLPPFLQASATASNQTPQDFVREELSLSFTYALLRENPSALNLRQPLSIDPHAS